MDTRDLIEVLQALGAVSIPGKTGYERYAGKNVFIRTVTHHYTGRVVEVAAASITLVDAAWIADDGRFNEAVKSGEVAEVEPYPDGLEVTINLGSLIDITTTPKLPRDVK